MGELILPIEQNVANREGWRLFKDQPGGVMSVVLATLHRYSIT